MFWKKLGQTRRKVEHDNGLFGAESGQPLVMQKEVELPVSGWQPREYFQGEWKAIGWQGSRQTLTTVISGSSLIIHNSRARLMLVWLSCCPGMESQNLINILP